MHRCASWNGWVTLPRSRPSLTCRLLYFISLSIPTINSFNSFNSWFKEEEHPCGCPSSGAPVCKGQSLASDDLRHVCRRRSCYGSSSPLDGLSPPPVWVLSPPVLVLSSPASCSPSAVGLATNWNLASFSCEASTGSTSNNT